MPFSSDIIRTLAACTLVLLSACPFSGWAADTFVTDRPKMLLIVDDIINAKQLNNGFATGLNLTYAFIPPSDYHPGSADIAAALDEYIIHLPLQAIDYHNEEIGTLHVDDDQQTITAHVLAVKQQYPKAQFVNNHTGSRFTADTDAMDKLLRALRLARLQFIDSKTIAATATRQIAPRQGMMVFERDIFLDYYDDESKILAKVKQAIRLAKRRGVVIVICHPRPKTFAVLTRYRSLFNDVELIQPSQLQAAYQHYRQP